MSKVIRNYSANGIEIYFDAMPSEQLRNELKKSKWRWHSYKKCWYNKYSEANMQAAKRFAEPEKVTNFRSYKANTRSNWTYGSISKWNEVSKLKELGYSVAKADGLTAFERHNILTFAIEHDIMTAEKVIRHLEMLIEANRLRDDMENARDLWSRDIKFVEQYSGVEIRRRA